MQCNSIPKVLMELSIPEGVPWMSFSASNPHLFICSSSWWFHTTLWHFSDLSWLHSLIFFRSTSGRQLAITVEWPDNLTLSSSAHKLLLTTLLVSLCCCPFSVLHSSLTLARESQTESNNSTLLIAPLLHRRAAAMHTEYAAEEPSPALAGRLATTVTWRPDSSLGPRKIYNIRFCKALTSICACICYQISSNCWGTESKTNIPAKKGTNSFYRLQGGFLREQEGFRALQKRPSENPAIFHYLQDERHTGSVLACIMKSIIFTSSTTVSNDICYTVSDQKLVGAGNKAKGGWGLVYLSLSS